jgi:hypothetical protein
MKDSLPPAGARLAPVAQPEAPVRRHPNPGWAPGAIACHFERIAEDAGSGAAAGRAGPVPFGGPAGLRLNSIPEVTARRRFENQVVTVGATLAC